MYFGYSDDERILKNSAHETFRKHVPIQEIRKLVDAPVINRALQSIVGQQGLLGVLRRTNSGYEGALMANALMEEAGRCLLPYPLVEGILAALFLSRDMSKKKLHDDIVSGAMLSTFAWHSQGMTQIKATNGKLLASGEFLGAPFAMSAERILVFFDGPGSNASTLAILDRHNPAVTVSHPKGMDVSMPQDRVVVRDYELTSDNVVLGVGKARGLWNEAQQLGAMLTAAELVGMSQEALEQTVEYTKVRKQFGQQIGKFQALKHMVADMYLLAESARVAVIYAGWALESGLEPEAVSIAKAYASNAANEITGQAIQIHGGMGFTWDSDLHLYFKRARRAASSFGDPHAHQEQVLNAILGATNENDGRHAAD